jgi:hypothetical protein
MNYFDSNRTNTIILKLTIQAFFFIGIYFFISYLTLNIVSFIFCLTTKGRQLERNFEELKAASHVPIIGTILNIFDVFVAVFFSLR